MSEEPVSENVEAVPEAPTPTLPLLLMVVSSLVASFCLGMLSYTFATGNLPFGAKPLIEPTEPNAEGTTDGDATDANPEEIQRPGEHYAWRLYQAIESRQAELDQQQDELAEERREVEELLRGADLREQELQRMETRITELLDRVDETEVANVKQIGSMLAKTDGKAAADMLLGMEQDLAARVLYFMDSKTSGELLTSIQKTGDASKEKAVEILEKLQRIAEEPAS